MSPQPPSPMTGEGAGIVRCGLCATGEAVSDDGEHFFGGDLVQCGDRRYMPENYCHHGVVLTDECRDCTEEEAVYDWEDRLP